MTSCIDITVLVVMAAVKPHGEPRAVRAPVTVRLWTAPESIIDDK